MGNLDKPPYEEICLPPTPEEAAAIEEILKRYNEGDSLTRATEGKLYCPIEFDWVEVVDGVRQLRFSWPKAMPGECLELIFTPDGKGGWKETIITEALAQQGRQQLYDFFRKH